MLGSKDELISDILPWTPTHGHTSIDPLAKSYFHLLCGNTEYRVDNLLRSIVNRDGW